MNSPHRLIDYIEALRSAGLLTDAPRGDIQDRFVSSAVFDSREAERDSLFVCKGEGFREEYLVSAFERGALCCVSETVRGEFPCIVVSDVRKAMAVIANVENDEAWRAFPLVGITGTKGKSTTTYYIKSIAEAYTAAGGLPPFAYISTIETFDGVESFESHLTTPEALELGRRFSHAKEAGVGAMIMEVSSQGLKYNRSDGVGFDIACFLNFGIDHIGCTEHSDEEDYLRSKLLLFNQSKTLVVNLDTYRLKDVLAAASRSESAERLVCFSASGAESAEGAAADYIASNVRKEGGNILFELMAASEGGFEKLCDISLSMPGLFNVENAMAAAIICILLDIPLEYIAAGLKDASAPGRMEHFRSDAKDIDVIVDYAHNELSFKRLFSSLKEEYPGRRLEVVFGCPGGKGLQRRQILPAVAAEFCDFAWITEEDPGFEDVEEISSQLLANLKAAGGEGRVITDRQLCIKTAMESAAPGTVLVLAAKGREGYMKRGDKYVSVLSDVDVAEKYL